MHRPLRLNNDRGLSQVLSGQARVRDVIQRTVDPNLLAITAGNPPPNPSELLASERMKTLLTNFLHGPFDWIIIDTPPVLAVTDAFVEVNPRHVSFYRRAFGFLVASEERMCERVKAPAVLLRLRLEALEAQMQAIGASLPGVIEFVPEAA